MKGLMQLAAWWRREDEHGTISKGYTGCEGRSRNNEELRICAFHYYSKVNPLKRKYREKVSILSKPNIHRGLEIFVHAMPLIGHIYNVGEIFLEGFHQVLSLD